MEIYAQIFMIFLLTMSKLETIEIRLFSSWFEAALTWEGRKIILRIIFQKEKKKNHFSVYLSMWQVILRGLNN